jgi:hypothetical protein
MDEVPPQVSGQPIPPSPATPPVVPSNPIPSSPPEPALPPSLPQLPPKVKSKFPFEASFLISGALLLSGLLSGFVIGRYVLPSAPKTAQPDQQPTAARAKKLEIPRDATAIADCAVGRGKQYVLPKDIPTGPVYNVWNNEVIGLEFMVGRDELLTQNKSFVDLPLGGAIYDHINIGLLSQGHSGFTQPHYHVDLFTISNEEAQKITCK